MESTAAAMAEPVELARALIQDAVVFTELLRDHVLARACHRDALLLVEPGTRQSGIGSRLVRECLRFAGQAGYAKVLLWTHSVLLAARRLYQREGFRLIAEEPHCSFGHELVGETWELIL